MKTKRLRALMDRFGAVGVLLVGAYLVLHHEWDHRRLRLLSVSTLVGLGLVWWVAHPKPARRPVVSHPVVLTPPQPQTESAPEAPDVSESDPEPEEDAEPEPAFPEPDVGAAPAINGDLFFAAQYFHKSGKPCEDPDYKDEETLADEGPSHLFRMRADGSHKCQLTHSESNDSDPRLSPDGKHLLFVRSSPEESVSLCLVRVNGGPVRTLFRLPGRAYAVMPRWSPDSRWIALTSDNEDAIKKDLVVLRVAQRTVLRFPNIKDFAWAPDGRLYMRDEEDHAQIVNLITHTSVKVKDVIHNALWLDEHTLVGDSPGSERYDTRGLRFINDKGRKQRDLALELIGRENEYETFEDSHAWYRLPRHRTTLILETWRGMSDGEHYGCYRVDTRTGKCRLIQNGSLIGISPDGNYVAVADYNWIGPYKRGGERVGPLQLVSLKTGRTRSVSRPLAQINGGDWRQGAWRRPRSLNAALLQAIEEGNLEQARRLLARGASSNAKYPDSTTALMLAAADGDKTIVHLLLKHHANVEAKNQPGATALLWAVGMDKASEDAPPRDQLEVVRQLAAADADINTQDKAGKTALMFAAEQGRATLTEWLVDQGADVNVQCHARWSALMYAAVNHYARTTRALVHHKANVNLRNRDGETALNLALLHGSGNHDNSKAVAILKHAGATE